jgi:MOSC domain-containing protein YiiM
MPKVVAVCASRSRRIPKRNIGVGFFERDYGLVGDANAGPGPLQVALLGVDTRARLAQDARLPLSNGALGENLLISGLDLTRLRLGSRVRIGEVILEVSQIGAEAGTPSAEAWATAKDESIIYCTVRHEGYVKAGDHLEVLE